MYHHILIIIRYYTISCTSSLYLSCHISSDMIPLLYASMHACMHAYTHMHIHAYTIAQIYRHCCCYPPSYPACVKVCMYSACVCICMHVCNYIHTCLVTAAATPHHILQVRHSRNSPLAPTAPSLLSQIPNTVPFFLLRTWTSTWSKHAYTTHALDELHDIWARRDTCYTQAPNRRVFAPCTPYTRSPSHLLP